MNKRINFRITGISPLLMHRFPLEPVPNIEKLPAGEQAEICLYRRDDGTVYVPGITLQRALVAGATYSKGKGRGSLQKPVSACVLIEDEHLPLAEQEYTIDARAVVIPATKGRIVRYRPRFDDWQVEGSVMYDPELLSEMQLRQVFDDTGSRVGLLDFRPEKKGPFGRFTVTHWEQG